jgi:hypothetical protein
MSHYHCEIVIPPTMDVEAAVASIMKPYDEDPREEDEDYSRSHAFWDFWVIGGRWAGHKLLAKYDQAQIDAFHEWCTAEKITVSGVQCGKQALQPESQIPKVDAKWNEMFPSAIPVPCPLFAHSNDQYGKGLSGTLPADVSRLDATPLTMKCSRVIFAGPSYSSETKEHTGPLEAKFMLCESQWNGCNHMKIDWDETFGGALEKQRESLKGYREEYAAKLVPQPDWLVVTVDYHS